MTLNLSEILHRKPDLYFNDKKRLIVLLSADVYHTREYN